MADAGGRGMPAALEPDDGPTPLDPVTMPQLVRAAAAAYGDDPAIVLRRLDGGTDTLTFRELDARSAALAGGLLAQGAGKGSRIGFIAGNGPLFALMLAAIGRIGAVAVPISTLVRAGELVRLLRHADVAGLIVQRTVLGRDYVERLREALPALRDGGVPLALAEVPYLRWIATQGDDLPPGFVPLDALAAGGGAFDETMLRAIEAEVHPTDQLIEIYTSGSMALPKGVRHDHGPMLARARYLRAMLGMTRGQEVATVLPMFWVGGLMLSLLPNLTAGAVTLCGERTLSNSRMAMGSVLADEDLALMASSRPYWGLGMSETLGPYAYGDELRVPGRPVCAPMDHFADGFEVRVADEEDRPVPPGTPGEIQLRGPAVSPGLHKIERERYVTADGFLKTGDMGLFEGERLHFVGRGGDVIKTAGANVSPLEVEHELQQLDGVHSAYVVGLPDRRRGQIVAAAIVAREGAPLDFAEIEATLGERLSGFKVPRLYVAIDRSDVPLLHSNKVARRAMAELVRERLGHEAS